jgi:hypothetical protein
MKAAALAAVLALLVGIATGALIERDRRALRDPAMPAAAVVAEARPAAPDDRIAALEAEIAAVTSRLAALEARPAAAAPPAAWAAMPAAAPVPADALPRLEAMRAEMAALIAKHDGEGLLFLARRLAALGEAGYPSIMEIAKILIEDMEKDPREFGDCDIAGTLLGEGSVPLLTWSLAQPELSPVEFRSMAIDYLSGRVDVDVAHLFLSALRTEPDPELVRQLCENISGRLRPAIMEDVDAAIRSLASNEPAIDRLLEGYDYLEEEAAEAAFKRLSAAGVPPAVRERAQAYLAWRSPPATGYLMLSVETGSSWHAAGIRTGDVIVEANGRIPEDKTYTVKATASDGSEVVTTGSTPWRSEIGEDETLVLRVLRDGEIREVTVRGTDGRWNGSRVEKGE